MLLDRLAGIGHFYLCQFLGRVEHQLFSHFICEHGTELLVLLHVNRAVTLVAGQYADAAHGLVYLVVDVLVVVRVACQAEAQRGYHGYEMQLQQACRGTQAIGCHHDEQAVLPGINLFEALDDGDMVGQRLFQIGRTLVANIHQQGGGLAVDEGKDAFVHVVVAGDGPVKAFCKGIERP